MMRRRVCGDQVLEKCSEQGSERNQIRETIMVQLMGTRNRYVSNVIFTNIVLWVDQIEMLFARHGELERTLSTDQEASVNTTRSKASHECDNIDLTFKKMGIWSTGRISEVKMIRPVAPSDCAALADIYNHYILNTSITFEASTTTGQKYQKWKMYLWY